jgi:hypothetical protein
VVEVGSVEVVAVVEAAAVPGPKHLQLTQQYVVLRPMQLLALVVEVPSMAELVDSMLLVVHPVAEVAEPLTFWHPIVLLIAV